MFRRDKEGRAFLDCLAALGTFGPPAPGLAVTGETTPEGQEGEGRRSQEEAVVCVPDFVWRAGWDSNPRLPD